MRLRRFVLVGLLAIAAPAAMQAQQLEPCKPLAPGARCSAKPSANVWRLDFGAPKPAPAPPSQQGPEPWQWATMTHRPSSNLMRAPMLEVPALLDHPVDCKMAKPADPSVDPKAVVTHRGHSTQNSQWEWLRSGRVTTVAPCKSK